MNKDRQQARPLTAEELRAAMRELPAHRRDLRDSLKTALSLVGRGFTVREDAPAWRQVQNVIAVSKVDVDFDADGRSR
jgi:hypothetical protein